MPLSGARTLFRARRPRLRVLAVLALGIVAVAVLQLWMARYHLLRGTRELTAASRLLGSPLRARDPAVREGLRRQLLAARGEFVSARMDLAPWTPLLDHLGWVPLAGEQLVAARPGADTAFYVADAALDLVDGLSPVWPALANDTGACCASGTGQAGGCDAGGQGRRGRTGTEPQSLRGPCGCQTNGIAGQTSGRAASRGGPYATRSMSRRGRGAPVSGRVAAKAGRPLLARLAAALQAGHDQFLAAGEDADRAARALRLLPRHSGNATLDRAAARLRRQLPLLRQASFWLSLAPRLLGAGRPARYLLAWQNPAELRATGGFIGASNFITIRDGQISNHFVGRAPPHEIRSALLPLPEAMYTNETYWIFADSNWSPNFPLSARLERWFYGEDTGLWADAVIDMVDTATPEVLGAAGPIYLPEYRLWVDASNLNALAQRYVNGRYWGPAQRGAPPDTLRKQFLAATLKALLHRIQTLPPDRWPAMLSVLRRLVARGDILLYHRDPATEAAIRDSGADGGLGYSGGDFLYVVDDNRSYNKLNPYVRETASYQVRILPDLEMEDILTLHYHVDPSPANLEGYGPAYGEWGSKHDYQDFLRVYVPPG
ncbi:MAG: DUF4012 domain-containing protein, partial [Chloroflexi bacterium]|nr:DUF4012 domain-containing protein [Chloroflexota bacterium]